MTGALLGLLYKHEIDAEPVMVSRAYDEPDLYSTQIKIYVPQLDRHIHVQVLPEEN